MKYTVDYFIKKFEAIPEYKWCVKKWFNGDQRCAFGHCGVKTESDLLSGEAKALIKLFGKPANEIFHINDGSVIAYQQTTPKQRILAALYDIKKLSYPELSTTTVEDIIREKVL